MLPLARRAQCRSCLFDRAADLDGQTALSVSMQPTFAGRSHVRLTSCQNLRLVRYILQSAKDLAIAFREVVNEVLYARVGAEVPDKLL